MTTYGSTGPTDSLMRAAAITEFGDADRLQIQRTAVPEPGPDEVLVRVEVAGVQPTDAAIRRGWAPPGTVIDFPQILGNEFAGTIVKAGNAVEEFSPGDEVLGFRVLECYAEYVSVPANQVVRKPAEVDWLTAGALSASGQTAHTALERLDARAGETLLVHGAAGGVGTVAVQLARLRGLTVIGTGSLSNQDYIRSLGAIPVIYGDGERDRIAAAASTSVDLALDTAGHGNLDIATHLVANRRRVATITEPGLANQLGCQWITSDRSQNRLTELVSLCARDQLRITIRATYPLEHAAQAHRDVETGHGRGKIALDIRPHNADQF